MDTNFYSTNPATVRGYYPNLADGGDVFRKWKSIPLGNTNVLNVDYIVSGFVFMVSGPVFGCLDLYFGCQPTTPWSMCLPQAFILFLNKHAPGISEHVFCECC